jgi:Surface adhesin CshA non-repetitive domain 2/GEVED domain
VSGAAARTGLALTALLLAAAGGLARAPDADARVATGGEGRFVGTIDWFEWGTAFQTISPGPVSRSSTTSIGGVDLVVTCSLSRFGGIALAYRPGSWGGDTLDDLYNVGGPEGANALVNGVATPADNLNPTTTFDVACSATLGGHPFALNGLVFADAEQTASAESVQATIATTATWRIVDRGRSPACAFSSAASRTIAGATSTLLLRGTTICAEGPAVVAFADGATSASVSMTSPGTGRSAVALGVLIPIDRSEAPSTYGVAAHVAGLALDGGVPPTPGPTLVNDAAFALANPAPPPTRLGVTVESGVAEGAPASIAVVPGATYTRSAIACTGPGYVAGWIDFDASGTFDAGERSQLAACAGGAVDLTWTVPAGARAQARTFERLRIAANAADAAVPTGFAASGEVEDHALALTLSAAPPPHVPPVPAPPPVPPPAPQPQLGRSVTVAEASGTVLVSVPGSGRYVALSRLSEIPLGSRVDARRGRVILTTETNARTGETQTAAFYAGVFVVTQVPGTPPLLEVKLVGGSFADCARTTQVTRSALGAAGGPVPFAFAARKRSRRSVRKLWGKGKGSFRTQGRRSSGTVRGTWWLVEDLCDSTFTRVRRGTVDVRDFRLHKTVRLRAGKRYLYRT